MRQLNEKVFIDDKHFFIKKIKEVELKNGKEKSIFMTI